MAAKKDRRKEILPEALPNEEGSKAQELGLPVEHFQRAVEAILRLRDTGKLLVFLSRRNSIRLIGDRADFSRELAQIHGESEISAELSAASFDEVQELLSAFGNTFKASTAIDFLRFGGSRFPSKGPDYSPEQKAAIEKKLKIVSESLVTDAMKRRYTRIKTSVGVSLEELDVDIVERRIDAMSSSPVTDPFLRVRLRHATADQKNEFKFPFAFFMRSPEPALSFEFDCDEADIDMLFHRLRDAKEALAAARKTKLSEGGH